MVVKAKVGALIISVLRVDWLASEGIAEVTLHESIKHLIIALKVTYILEEHSFLLWNSHSVKVERDTTTAKATLGADRIGIVHHLWMHLGLRAFSKSNFSSIVEVFGLWAGLKRTTSLICRSRPTCLSLEVEANRLIRQVLPALDDLLLANRD